jgi:hypothetical protein
MQMCAGDINITIDSALRYIKDKNLTFNNAHAELQKYFAVGDLYTERLVGSHRISVTETQSVFNSSFWHFLKAPPELQNKILAEIGFESPIVQENFRSIPLYYALEWISTCRHKAGAINLISPQNRCLLNYEQFYCLKKILDSSARAATNKELADNYIAEYENEQVRSFAFITSGDKKILSSLPDKFVQAEHALLKDILVAEKPSMIHKTVGTPLSMMLHSVRSTSDGNLASQLNPCNWRESRLALSILIAGTNFVVSGMSHYELLATSVNIHKIIWSLLTSSTFNIVFPIFYKSITKPHGAVAATNTCVLRNPKRVIQSSDLGFIMLTPINILFQYFPIAGPSIPLNYIFTGLTPLLASFMIYDYFKYPRKYAVKTQTITELIEGRKKDTARRPMCTLL